MKKLLLLVILLLLCYTGNLFAQMNEDLGYDYWRNLHDAEKITFVRGIISGMYTTGFALLEYTDGDIAGITSFLPPINTDHPSIYHIVIIELAYDVGFYSYTPSFIIFYQEAILEEIGKEMSLSMIEIKSTKIVERLKHNYKGGW